MALRRRPWHPTPVLLPGKSHGWRSLVGCSPWGCEESDTTERLPFHFSLSCTGEGNGNPLQCSCLENPRDGEAWWAAFQGVAQSWTQRKQLSSSSSFYNLDVSWCPLVALKVRHLQIVFRSSKPFSYQPQFLGVSSLFCTRLPDARGLPCFVHIIPDIDLNLFTFFHRKSIHVRPFVRLTVLTEDLMMTGRHCV